MDIGIYSARNQVAHQRILASTLQLASVISIPEPDLDVLTRIKAQDQDVHSLYQREAVAGVLEAVVAYLGIVPDQEPTEDTSEAEPTEIPSDTTEDVQPIEQGELTPDGALTEPAPPRRRKGGAA